MKKLFISILALFALNSGPLFAVNPLAPDTKFQGSRNVNPVGSVITNEGTIINTTGTIQVGTAVVGVPFSATATLTSAAAGTAVTLLADTAVPAGKKVYITNYFAKVNGATDWTTTASITIQDTNGTPVVFVTLTASTLNGNEFHGPLSDSATIGSAMALGTGGTVAKGLVIKGNANGAGSNLVVTVTGFIR
jgi:hypothetical protein